MNGRDGRRSCHRDEGIGPSFINNLCMFIRVLLDLEADQGRAGVLGGNLIRNCSQIGNAVAEI